MEEKYKFSIISLAVVLSTIFIIKSRFLMNLFWMIASYIGLEIGTQGIILPIVIMEVALFPFLIYKAIWWLFLKIVTFSILIKHR